MGIGIGRNVIGWFCMGVKGVDIDVLCMGNLDRVFEIFFIC